MSVRLLNSAFIRMNNSDKQSKYSALACDFFFLILLEGDISPEDGDQDGERPWFPLFVHHKKETNAVPSQWIYSPFRRL